MMEIEKLYGSVNHFCCFFKLYEQNSTPDNFQTWLLTLDQSQRKKFDSLDFEKGRQLISLQSYLLERKGVLIRKTSSVCPSNVL